MSASFTQLLASSFDKKSIPDSIFKFIEFILNKRKPLGVIYYGSSLWKGDLSGLLDFYIVCEQLDDWYFHNNFKKIANAWLPPNIEYYEWKDMNTLFRAKVAILSLEQLRKATYLNSIDTTMWARFCQPVKILWWKDKMAQQALFRCIVRAVGTAIWWAAYLGPKEGTALDYWCSLFRHTYNVELRVEAKNRPMLILENREDYFTALLKLGWKKLGIFYKEMRDHHLKIEVSQAQKERMIKQWGIRKKLGRPLNIIRLIKAAFTFKGGPQYIIWKINRHCYLNLTLNNFQKNHPFINAPWILFKLYRQGMFKR